MEVNIHFMKLLNFWACVLKLRSKHIKDSKALIYYDTDNTVQISREILFFRPQNDT